MKIKFYTESISKPPQLRLCMVAKHLKTTVRTELAVFPINWSFDWSHSQFGYGWVTVNCGPLQFYYANWS